MFTNEVKDKLKERGVEVALSVSPSQTEITVSKDDYRITKAYSEEYNVDVNQIVLELIDLIAPVDPTPEEPQYPFYGFSQQDIRVPYKGERDSAEWLVGVLDRLTAHFNNSLLLQGANFHTEEGATDLIIGNNVPPVRLAILLGSYEVRTPYHTLVEVLTPYLENERPIPLLQNSYADLAPLNSALSQYLKSEDPN